jgi:hypothetical protein
MANVTQRISPSNSKFYSLDSILPEHLKENTKFTEFLQEYFNWMQLDESSPVSVINNLDKYRDSDLIDENFLRYLEREVAASIPGNLPNTDKRKLYKQVNDIYRAKGSIPSFEALFNLLYGDDIELYYPRVDLMKLSDGNWNEDENRYLNKGSFLSDYNYIQDSYYYQDYSYVIKTRKPYAQWEASVRKLLHPSGFALFGRVTVVSQATVKRLKSPLIQPGSSFTSYDNVIPIRLAVVKATTTVVEIDTFLETTYFSIGGRFGPAFSLLDKIKFVIDQPMKVYKQFTLKEARDGSPFNILPGSTITVS